MTPGGAAPADGPRQHLPAGARSTPRSPTTSGRATSPRCASWRCCGSPTGSRTASQSYMRRATASTDPWETRERVVVAVTGAPGGDQLIRRAARIAGRSAGRADRRARLGQRRTGPARRPDGLDAQRRLLDELGGAYHEVVGDDVAMALVGRRRGREGHPARARRQPAVAVDASAWPRLGRQRVLRAAGELDVHVISSATTRSRAVAAPACRVRRAPCQHAAGASRRCGDRRDRAPVAHRCARRLGATSSRCPSILLLYLVAGDRDRGVGGVVVGAVAALAAFAPRQLVLHRAAGPHVHDRRPRERRGAASSSSPRPSPSARSSTWRRRRSEEAHRARAEAEALAALAGVARRAEADPVLPSTASARARRDAARSTPVPCCRGTRRRRGASSRRRPSPVPATPSDAAVVGATSDATNSARRRRRRPRRRRPRVAQRRSRTSSSSRSSAPRLAGRGRPAERLDRGRRAAHRPAPAVSPRPAHAARRRSRRRSRACSSDDVDWPDAERPSSSTTIDDETDRLDRLVGNLLDMSRLQAGALAAAWRHRSASTRSSPPRSPAWRRRSATVDVDVPETLPPVARRRRRCWSGRSPTSSQRRRASSPPDARGPRSRPAAVGGPLDLRVVDRGPGIPDDDRERLFEPFQRLGDRSGHDGRRARPGVARGFVEAMGGELMLDDTPGGGADRRRIRLQVAAMTDASSSSTTSRRSAGRCAINLGARGYEVELAATGEEALESPPRHAARRRAARPRPARHRRPRGDRRAARLDRRADRRAVGARTPSATRSPPSTPAPTTT